MQKTLEVTFLSDWHISSGLGDGYRADSVLVRDGDGFPFIPGRALKGALREGARRLGQCRADLKAAENRYFGTRHDDVDSNESGRIRVSSAHFSEAMKKLVRDDFPEKRQIIDDVTVIRSQTALTDEGVARTSSLRSIECGIVGTTLYASLDIPSCDGVEDKWAEQYFAAVCAAVKSIGGNRSRGLGRCRIRIVGNTAAVLPEENSFFREGGGV